MFRDVVAAIDGSPSSFRAAGIGAQLAGAVRASVHLVTVIEPKGEFVHRLGIGRHEDAELHERRLADLRSAAAMIGGTAPVRSKEVLNGPVVESLLGSCHPDQSRLLCLGAGRHRLGLGSVSAAVVRRTDCPVLVVREGVSAGPRIGKILVGFDGSAGSFRAVDAAAAFAPPLGAEVSLVQVLKPSWPMPAQGLDLPADEVQALAGEPERREIEEARQRLEGSGCTIARAGFELGQAPDRLLALADAWNADLIVVGAHGKSPARRWFLGGVSDHVSSRSDRPVLVMR